MDTQDAAGRFPGAMTLGEHGGYEFVQVHAVLALAGEEVRFHCLAEEWDGSPEAKAIALDQAIEAKRQELEGLLRVRGQVHALGDSRDTPALALPAPAPAPAPKKRRRWRRFRCLKCGEICGNLGSHGKYNHPGVPIEELRGEEVAEDDAEAPTPAELAPGVPERAVEAPVPAGAGTATPSPTAPTPAPTKEADPK